MSESKILFEVETAWPFPILQYNINASYFEVKKASGIAYILLQLISSSINRSEGIVATLKSFGVPNDIQYIFIDELENMLNYEIIKIKDNKNFDRELIKEYIIADFEITNLGKKLTAEGTIPTGNIKDKNIQLYYDASYKDIQQNPSYRLFKLETSSLNKECMGDTTLNKDDIEIFINNNIDKYGFKKGEQISEIKYENPEILVYKLDDAVKMKFFQNNLQIQAKDKERDKFIHAFYDIETITKIIDTKKKYRFPDILLKEVEEFEFDSMKNIVKLAIPSQLSTLVNIKSPLALNRKYKIKGSECSIENNEADEILKKYNVKGIACYFENNHLYSIIPGRFLINIEGYSKKCAINLILIQEIEQEIQLQIMDEILINCINTSNPFERCNIVKKLCHILDSKDYMAKFANSLLENSYLTIEKIKVFLKLNNEFCKEKEWNNYAINTSKELFDKLCNEVTLKEFNVQDTLGKELNKLIKLTSIDYLAKITHNLDKNNDKISIFNTLEEANYKTELILSVVNIFKIYCQDILNDNYIEIKNELSKQCNLFGQALAKLKKLTDIYNPYEDFAKLDFDNENFIKIMSSFSESIKKLEKYHLFAEEEFKIFIDFQERFIEIKEFISIENEASKNPKHINKDYIEQKLKKSKYKEAICDLHIRLQYELNRLFCTNDASTFELLSTSEIENYLLGEEINELHNLRKCRNGFQHPKNKRKVEYSEKTINKWCLIVEKLGGINNESCS